jgi:hypothetical protein
MGSSHPFAVFHFANLIGSWAVIHAVGDRQLYESSSRPQCMSIETGDVQGTNRVLQQAQRAKSK